MLQLFVARSLLLCLLLGSSWAGVGRQRRLQMSATSTRAGQAAGGFGLPLLQTTIATNEEYTETPFRRPLALALAQQQQQQQQPRQLHTNIFAEELPVSEPGVEELLPAQLQQQLLYGAPQQLQYQLASQARHWHNKNSESETKKEHAHPQPQPQPIVVVIPPHHHHNSSSDGATHDNSNTNTVNTVLTFPTAPANANFRTDFGQMPQYMPVRYFQTRQDQSPAPGLIGFSLGGLSGYGDGSVFERAGFPGFGGSAPAYNRFANVPLVPVTLGNNVGYVPLNLPMYRQLLDTVAPPTPIREGESESEDLQSQTESSDAQDDAGTDNASGSRFQFFGQRLRPRPVAAAAGGYALRNPLMSMAQNLRRVQYL